MDGRYELFACKGKGVFSTVLRARDMLRADPNNPGAKVRRACAARERTGCALLARRAACRIAQALPAPLPRRRSPSR